MQRSPSGPVVVLSVLTLLIAVLSSVAALAGVLTAGGPGTHEITSLRGAPVTLYGEGLFAFDTRLLGVGNRGQDLILLSWNPLLLAALLPTGGGPCVVRSPWPAFFASSSTTTPR